jgi:hypothetical protein
MEMGMRYASRIMATAITMLTGLPISAKIISRHNAMREKSA